MTVEQRKEIWECLQGLPPSPKTCTLWNASPPSDTLNAFHLATVTFACAAVFSEPVRTAGTQTFSPPSLGPPPGFTVTVDAKTVGYVALVAAVYVGYRNLASYVAQAIPKLPRGRLAEVKEKLEIAKSRLVELKRAANKLSEAEILACLDKANDTLNSRATRTGSPNIAQANEVILLKPYPDLDEQYDE